MDDATRWRMFVAVPVPPVLKEALQEVQYELRGVIPKKSAAWTRPDNMHLTLRFLGHVDPARVGEVQERLNTAVAGFGPLQLVCERLGCFPDLRFPRVVWTWVHDGEERLPQLVQRVNEATRSFAERAPEVRFTGHITLARPRRIRKPEAGALAKFVESAVARKFGAWSAEEFELIRSELSSGGSRYTTIGKFSLM